MGVFLKSGIVIKAALFALSLVLGCGGIAAGARFSAQHAATNKRQVIAGQILAAEREPFGNKFFLRVKTRSGAILTLAVTATTSIHYKGAPYPARDLVAGTRFIGRVRFVRNRIVEMAAITVTHPGPQSASGP